MIKAMLCPQCGGNINVETDNEYGFCSFCGTKIQLHDVIEVRHSGTIKIDGIDGYDGLIERGDTYLKLSDWQNAIRMFEQAIDLKPSAVYAYEQLTLAVTRCFTDYSDTTFLAAQKLFEKISSVSSLSGTQVSDAFTEKAKKYIELRKCQNDLNRAERLCRSIRQSFIFLLAGDMFFCLVLIMGIAYVIEEPACAIAIIISLLVFAGSGVACYLYFINKKEIQTLEIRMAELLRMLRIEDSIM